MKLLLVFVQIALTILSISAAPKQCKNPLMEYKTCQSSSCIKTCENPNPSVCTLDCRQGCFCKEPLVLDRIINRCVEIQHCTKLCRTNEEYKKCGYCDSTCKGMPLKCTRNCRSGCYCKKGFVRHEGSCINPRLCSTY